MKSNRIDLAALILRFSLGAMFIAHGWLKVSVFTLAGTAQFFDSAGFPAWSAYPVTAAEFAAGIALITGIATRWVALGMLPVLLGALYVHLGNGWLFTNENGGWEYPAFLAASAVALSLLGDGRYSLRTVLENRRNTAPATA